MRIPRRVAFAAILALGSLTAGPVTKTVLHGIPEKAQLRLASHRGQIYAFHYVDDDHASAAKLAEGGRVYRYDPDSGKWEARARMPLGKASYSLVPLNGKMYVIGGFTAPDTPSGSVEEYDPDQNVWTIRKSMPTPRCRMGTAVLDGRIYVFGGKTREGVTTDAVEAYDPIRNAWSVRRRLSRPGMGIHGAAANGKFYKVKSTELSGSQFSMVLDFEEYSPAANAWTRKSPWLWEKEPLEVAVAQGRLFVVGAGAFTDSSAHSLKEYVFAEDRWVFRSDMPASSAHTIHPIWTVMDGRIYTFGGGYRVGNRWQASDHAQRYDPATDTWEELPPLSDKKMAMGLAVVGNRIFIMGGERMEGSWEPGKNPYSEAIEVYEVRDAR